VVKLVCGPAKWSSAQDPAASEAKGCGWVDPETRIWLENYGRFWPKWISMVVRVWEESKSSQPWLLLLFLVIETCEIQISTIARSGHVENTSTFSPRSSILSGLRKRFWVMSPCRSLLVISSEIMILTPLPIVGKLVVQAYSVCTRKQEVENSHMFLLNAKIDPGSLPSPSTLNYLLI